MKVVFSDKLRRVLQDPQASEQLRQFMATASVNQPSQVKIKLHDGQRQGASYDPRLSSTTFPDAEPLPTSVLDTEPQ